MHTYMHTYIPTYIHTHIHTLHTYIHAYIHTRSFAKCSRPIYVCVCIRRAIGAPPLREQRRGDLHRLRRLQALEVSDIDFERNDIWFVLEMSYMQEAVLSPRFDRAMTLLAGRRPRTSCPPAAERPSRDSQADTDDRRRDSAQN